MAGRVTREGVMRGLYDAALTGAWQPALRDLASLLGGVGSIIEVHPKALGPPLLVLEQGMPTSGLEAYQAHYHSVCPRLPSLDAAPGTVDYDYRHVSAPQIARSEFYQDFLAPDGLRHFVGGVLENSSDEIALLGVHYDLKRPHATDSEIDLAESLLDDVRRSVEIYRRLRAATRSERLLRAALDQVHLGALIVDRRGRVTYANRAAVEIDKRHPSIVLSPTLRAALPRDRPRLAALMRALALGVGHTTLVGTEAPLLVTAAPLHAGSTRARLGLDDGERAVIFVADPSRDTQLREALLGTVYGLTPAEVALAQALVDGHTVAEFAAQRAVTIHTARAQLAQLRAKLGVSRQAEALRLLMALHPPVA